MQGTAVNIVAWCEPTGWPFAAADAARCLNRIVDGQHKEKATLTVGGFGLRAVSYHGNLLSRDLL